MRWRRRFWLRATGLPGWFRAMHGLPAFGRGRGICWLLLAEKLREKEEKKL
jgi:hypothetical protein